MSLKENQGTKTAKFSCRFAVNLMDLYRQPSHLQQRLSERIPMVKSAV